MLYRNSESYIQFGLGLRENTHVKVVHLLGVNLKKYYIGFWGAAKETLLSDHILDHIVHLGHFCRPCVSDDCRIPSVAFRRRI